MPPICVPEPSAELGLLAGMGLLRWMKTRREANFRLTPNPTSPSTMRRVSDQPCRLRIPSRYRRRGCDYVAVHRCCVYIGEAWNATVPAERGIWASPSEGARSGKRSRRSVNLYPGLEAGFTSRG